MDGAGKVDGSIVVALPVDRWSAPSTAVATSAAADGSGDGDTENVHEFVGGGLTVWDGQTRDAVSQKLRPEEIHYDTRSGDVAFLDRYVRTMRCFVSVHARESRDFVRVGTNTRLGRCADTVTQPAGHGAHLLYGCDPQRAKLFRNGK